MDSDVDDPRDEELATIAAIFPELVIDARNSHSAFLTVSVSVPKPVKVVFQDEAEYDVRSEQTHELTYFPPLPLQITLPDGYPNDKPPIFKLDSNKPITHGVTHSSPIGTGPPLNWLSPELLRALEEKGKTLWEELYHGPVVYEFIDFLLSEAANLFGRVGSDSVTIFPAHVKHALVDYNRAAHKAVFRETTFDCGVCLEPKKGSVCHRLRNCGHVFCCYCLKDFYVAAITDGDIDSVKCIAPDCGKEGLNTAEKRVHKQKALHPIEVREIGVDEGLVRRYMDLKVKKMLESDKLTIYCPRKWCQGPARSAKYERYLGSSIEDFPDSDPDSEEEKEDAGVQNHNAKAGRRAPLDRLSLCTKCEFAFCRVCRKSWHGDLINCLPPRDVEYSEEEQASFDYIRLNTSPCPTCNSPTQKTHGCNHMRCFQCKTHFCYLCSAWLMPGDPYRHFNTRGTECYQKLWELEEGDEGAGGHAFGGARGAEAAAAGLLREEELEDEEDELLENLIALGLVQHAANETTA